VSDAEGPSAVRERLFVYGSLLPPLAPAELRGWLAGLRPLGPAALRGALYDLGEHPAAVPDAASAGWVAGEVFELPRDPALLARLDAYEDFSPDRPERSPFVRVRCTVALARGGELECWVYAWSRDPRGAPRVASGDWLAHVRSRAGRSRGDQG
jgi:gamma-glutamylcyclotransferase (GGCT)/AIG2-like uncharacterized protein YtfP